MSLLSDWDVRLRERQMRRRYLRIERDLSDAMMTFRELGVPLDEEPRDLHYYLLQDLNRFLIDLQIYKKFRGVISQAELMQHIDRVRGGRLGARTSTTRLLPRQPGVEAATSDGPLVQPSDQLPVDVPS